MPLGRRRRTFQPGGTLAAPVNTGLPSLAGLPGVGVQLSCFFGVWTGFPTPTFAYQWKRDGTTDIGTNSPFYTQVLADKDALITCVVTATNSQGSANATSNAIGPVVSLPSSTSAPVASATAVVGQTASVAPGDWLDAVSFAYQWFQNGVLVPGATLTTFLLSTAGASVYCRVTATNTGGSASANSNTLGPVGLAPQNTAPPAITGTPAAGQTLTRSTGSWNGYPANYTYATKWYADGVAIVGQTGATLSVTPVIAGKAITVGVVATNSTGSSTEVFSAATPLVTSPPSFEGPPVLSGGTSVGQTVSVATPQLYAYPPASLSYEWYADTLLIAGADSGSHTLDDPQEGDVVTVVVTATNIYGSDTDTSNGIGPIQPPEPVPGEWDFSTEDGFIIVTEDNVKLVAEDHTNDLLFDLVITPKVGGTMVSATSKSRTKTGKACILVVPDGTPTLLDGDVEDWATNGNPAAIWRATFDLTSLTDGIPGITGLTQQTGYDLYVVLRLTTLIGDYSNVLTGSFTSLDAPPALSDPRATAKDVDKAIASWITTDQTGSTKWGIWPAAATPSDDDVIAGTGAVVSGTKTNTATGRVSLPNITGLSANTAYKFHAIQVDSGTLRSNRITVAFSTPAVQTTAFQYANAGVSTGLTISQLAVTTAQTDPLGGSNAIKLLKNPAGVSTACTVGRVTTGGVVATSCEAQFFVKKEAWASAAAWVRYRLTSTDVRPVMPLNLDTAEFGTTSASVLNKIAIPLEDGFIFVKAEMDLYLDASIDTDGLFNLELCRSSTDPTIQTSGDHAIKLFDFKVVNH